MLKFLPGLILLQIITIALFLIAPENLNELNGALWVKVLLPIVVCAVLMALWFSSISTQKNQETILKLKENHLKECEAIRSTLQHEIFQLKESHAKTHEKILTSNQSELLNIKESHAKERERIRINAERAKHKITKEAQKHVEKEIRRTSAKANFKVGAAVAGVVGLGGLLVLTQFVTLGVMLITTAGGTMGGYLLRYRQEKTPMLPRNEKVVVLEPENKKKLPNS